MSTPDHMGDPIEADTELLTSREVAELFNVSISTIRYWKKQGYLLPQTRTPGGRNRYSRKQAARLLAERATENRAGNVDTAEAVRLYEQGWSAQQVAEQFDVSYRVMHRLLRKHITMRSRGGYVPTPISDTAEAVRLYEQGWSVQHVAEQFDVSYRVMRQLLRKHTTLRGPGATPTPISDTAEAVQLYKQGWSVRQVAEKFDVGHDVMERLLRKHTTLRGPGGYVPTRISDTAEAVRLYKQGWSVRQVAEKFDVGHDVMRRLLRKHTTLRGRNSPAPASDEKTHENTVTAYEAQGYTRAQAERIVGWGADPPAT